MVVGYVFSRKDNKEFEIVKGSPPGDKKDLNKKLYELLKPYIFDPFFCGDASHTDRSHFGLGLSIAQSLVKGLNGSIGILDTDGGGTTFILNLPLDHRIAVSSPKNVSEKL